MQIEKNKSLIDPIVVGFLFLTLKQGTENVIYSAIADGSFDQLVPRLQLTSGCCQGNVIHLEGDVAKHTAKVVSKLVEFSKRDVDLVFDRIDLLAALMHDVQKTATRVDRLDGSVSFPGHEAAAAARVPEIARRLNLTEEEEVKLFFLVNEHGTAHGLPHLPVEVQKRLLASKYWRNLRLLQMADALSCYLNFTGTNHPPVHWEEFDRLKESLGSSS